VTEVKTPSPRLPGFLNYDTAWVETERVMFFFFFFVNGKPHENVTCYSTTSWQWSFSIASRVDADIRNNNITSDKNWMQERIANKTVDMGLKQ
jgi:hypothetical protein